MLSVLEECLHYQDLALNTILSVSPSGVFYSQALYHRFLCSLHIFLFHLQ